MEDSLSKFRAKIIKPNSSKKHKVSNSHGVDDYLKYYRDIRPRDSKYAVLNTQFHYILRRINKLLVEKLVSGEDIKFPYGMGTLVLMKYEPKVTIKDGKIKTNRHIDWDKTIQLWYEDKEAHKNKTLIKKEDKEVFTIKYPKHLTSYVHRRFYDFSVVEEVRIQLMNNVKEGTVDAVKNTI